MAFFNCLTLILLVLYQGVFSLPTNNLQSLTPHSYSPLRRSNFPQESSESNEKSMYEPEMEFLKSSDENEIDSNIPLMETNEPVNSEIINDESSNEIEIYRKLIEEIKNDEDIALKSAYLMRLLQDSVNGPLPVVYVEEPKSILGVNKRSGRYYRRYPWKRQNSRNRTTYEADSRYLCVPSREDVFKLLVGLHENRNGNQQKQVNFCNRKRPAKVIFTNIRFLG